MLLYVIFLCGSIGYIYINMQKKNILLLGGYGFIGTNFIKYIDRYYLEKYNVIVFDRFNEHSHGVKFNSVINSYSGDFSDKMQLENIFSKHSIDIVFHFLSSTVPATSVNAQYDIESNLIPTVNLLGIMDKYGVKDIVYLSSGGAIYGDYLKKVHNEEDAVYPKSSYGVVKLAIEKYLLSFADLYGFHSLILRLSNPYGPYHYNNKQGVINIAIRQALKNEKFYIWGNGEGLKDYIYIDDVCDIIMRLINDGVHTDVYNVASSEVLSVNEIVSVIKRVIPSFLYDYAQSSMNDVQSFELDITKMRRQLKTYKMTPLNDAISRIIKWQKMQLNM